jgi:hypothetical protein
MTEDDDLNNVRYKAKYRYETTSYEELLDAIEKLKARIAVLEKALVASEQDYEKLLKVQGATVDEAWQKYCEEIMPQKTAHIYPLAGAMYKTFVTGWNAALKNQD